MLVLKKPPAFLQRETRMNTLYLAILGFGIATIGPLAWVAYNMP